MKEATKYQLLQILAEHVQEAFKASIKQARTFIGPETFDQEFERIREQVIRPIMVELHDLMKQHGLKSRIIVDNRAVGPDGKLQPAKISFEYLVLTDAEAEGLPVATPTVEFIAQPEAGRVLINENSALPFVGGHVGPVGQYALGDMTSDVVEKYLLDVTRNVLRGTGVS
jgi:hypothetical protein